MIANDEGGAEGERPSGGRSPERRPPDEVASDPLARIIPLVAATVLVSAVGDVAQIRNPWVLPAVLAVRAVVVAMAPGPGDRLARMLGIRRPAIIDPARYVVLVMALDMAVRLLRPGLGPESTVASLMLFLLGVLRLPRGGRSVRWALPAYAAGILARAWWLPGTDPQARWYVTAVVAIIGAFGLYQRLLPAGREEASVPSVTSATPATPVSAEEPGPGDDLADLTLARVDALPLSAREKQVVGLLLIGRKRTSISEELGISANTVKKHLANAYEKLGISSKEEMYDLVNGRNTY